MPSDVYKWNIRVYDEGEQPTISLMLLVVAAAVGLFAIWIYVKRQ